MIGGDRTTVHFHGKTNPMVSVRIPRALLRELEIKGEALENKDEVRIWLEKTGNKSLSKPWAFGRGKKDESRDGKADNKIIS